MRNGRMHIVLEDSRWRLRETLLSDNFNERDSAGALMTGSEQSITQLVAYIAGKSGLTITVGNVPTYNPPAPWAGMTADVAMQKLLDDTGCRLVYQPLTGAYNFTQAFTGSKPSATGQIFRPSLPNKLKTLRVASAPVMYESRMPAKAVLLDRATGEVIDAVGFVPDDPDDTEKQVELRYWAPTAVNFPVSTSVDDTLLLPYRVKSHLNTAGTRRVMESGRLLRDSWEPWPYHQPFVQPEGSYMDDLAHTSGGRVFVCEHPQLIMDTDGTLKTTADLFTGYLRRVSGDLVREVETIDIGGDGTSEKNIILDWIKPIESPELDIGTPQWPTLLTSVANAIANVYKGDPETRRYSSPRDLAGSGRVGGARYEAQTTLAQPRLYFQVALDFLPGQLGNIR